jgi:hypothetical protein
MENIYETQSSDEEQILVPCEHCGGTLNLAYEDTCSECGISCFLSKEDIAKDIAWHESLDIIEGYRKRINELKEKIGPISHVWTDKPPKPTPDEIQLATLEHLLGWEIVLSQYIQNNNGESLAHWLIKEYRVPTLI